MKCGFKQLSYVVNKTILYQEDYPYESSLTKAGEKHFYEFAESVIKKYKFKKRFSFRYWKQCRCSFK